jgi:hypothetical protein
MRVFQFKTQTAMPTWVTLFLNPRKDFAYLYMY